MADGEVEFNEDSGLGMVRSVARQNKPTSGLTQWLIRRRYAKDVRSANIVMVIFVAAAFAIALFLTSPFSTQTSVNVAPLGSPQVSQ